MKIPLAGIGWAMIKQAVKDPSMVLEARLAGTGRDGGPACGTVRPAHGWKLVRRQRDEDFGSGGREELIKIFHFSFDIFH